MKKLTLLSLIAAGASPLSAATLASYDFGASGLALDFTSNDTDVNSTAGNITVGAGITATDTNVTGQAGRAFGAVLQNSPGINGTTEAGAITANDYISFTITPVAGYQLNLTSLQFAYLVLGADNAVQESTYRVYADVPGFGFTSGNSVGSAVGAINQTTYSTTPAFSLANSAFQNITTSTEFRIYISDRTSNSASVFASLDNVVLSGNSVLIPEPSSLMLVGASGFLVLLRRRK